MQFDELKRRQFITLLGGAAPQQQVKSHVIKKTPAAAAVARPEASHAVQPLDVSLFHRGDDGRLIIKLYFQATHLREVEAGRRSLPSTFTFWPGGSIRSP